MGVVQKYRSIMGRTYSRTVTSFGKMISSSMTAIITERKGMEPAKTVDGR